MRDTTSFPGAGFARRIVLVAVLALAFAATAAAQAGATVQVDQATDPVGDPTVFTYTVTSTPTDGQPIQQRTFNLTNGQRGNVGGFTGTVLIQATMPAGWVVADIQCIGPRQTDFAIDIPNSRVTVTHGIADEQFCAFTTRRATAPAAAAGSGVAPAIPTAAQNKVVQPNRAGLLRRLAGRGFASAFIRVPRRSVIRGRLLTSRGRVLGTHRIVARRAGIYEMRVRISAKNRKRLRARGLRRMTLTLRVVVVPRGGKAQVFTPRLRVRL